MGQGTGRYLDSHAVSSFTLEPTLPPDLRTAVPGPQSVRLAERLARVESRNVTALAPVAPIFWERAQGSNVWDVDGNRYVDLTGAFGVANVGHAHPRVATAIAAQSASLLHAMGDVHPTAVKVELLERLAALYPGGGPARAVLGSSGADAVEIALKTAMIASGRAGVVAFEGGYHGLGLGALDLTWREDFKAPFADRLPGATAFARYADLDDVMRAAGSCRTPVGAVIVEPLQGRGGERVPEDGFLRALRERCDAEGWLLIVDEIYTGFGRTGRTFACEHEDVVPDLMCVGKGLSSGMPISACVGRAEAMDAWPISRGEAIHTQTFLGHPAGCAAALASLDILEEDQLATRASELGKVALDWLGENCARHPLVADVRGRGLMIGIECDSGDTAGAACAEALRQGVITLPSGENGRVLSITPPLTIERDILLAGLERLTACLP
jgi:4-aminobutyrate aminotransferase-like enzyme